MFKWFGKVNYSPYTKVGEFANYLKNGKIMGSKCKECGVFSFPPRADCHECMSDQFEFAEISGRVTLHSFTRIVAAPTGFEDIAPYTIGVVDLEEGGRALAWFDESIKEDQININMSLKLVPKIFEETEEIKVYYSLIKN